MRQYLFSIVAAGIICALVTVKFGKNDPNGRLIHLLCGIYMTLTIISPWRHIQISSWVDSIDLNENQKDQIIAEGERYADERYREVIKEQCRTYIVEKANGMGVDIDAEVALNQGDPPTPYAVTIIGGVSPYAKTRLEEILMQDLGIPKEQQIWK